MDFYKNTDELDELKRISKPTLVELERVMSIIKDEEILRTYFYEKNQKGALSSGWVQLLDKAGEFEDLDNEEGKVGAREQTQAKYLADIAEKRGKKVLEVIGRVAAKDDFIQGKFLEALLEMDVDLAVRGTWIVCRYLEGHQPKFWHFIGRRAAELMVKLTREYKNEAFGIAEKLLEVWKEEGKERSRFRDIEAKFNAHEYNELVFKYYSKLWDVDATRAVRMLIKIFRSYLDELQNSKDYEVSSHFYITLENLDEIERIERNIVAIIARGICEGGKAVIEKQPKEIDKLLDYMWNLDKAIFRRIVMYLLRFVPEGRGRDRINEILGNRKFLETPGYKYEYNLLLRDKFEEVTEETKAFFVERIKGERVDDIDDFAKWFERTRGRKHTPEDLEKYENRIRASKLYLVREKFSELYEQYREKSGASDEELAPKPMIRAGRRMGATEDSPISVEEMVKMEPQNVLEYIRDPKKREVRTKGESLFHTPEEALAATFKEVVKKRAGDYVNLDINKELLEVGPRFLSQYFYAVWDIIRSQEWKIESWVSLLDLAHSIVGKNKDNEEYSNCFSAILSTLRDGFGEGDNSIKFDEVIIETFWGILKPLVKYDEEAVEARSSERDPIQMRCSSVNGEALEQVVMLGIICKHECEKYYEEYLNNEIKNILDYVVNEIKRAEVNCTLGIDFARIYWLDKDWLEKSLEKIFEGEMWDVVWGAYTSWGRPSQQAFKLLLDKGKYKRALELIGQPNRYKFDKDPEKGLTEHIMIALFNGWVEPDKHGLLEEFLEKPTAKLRGYAGRFLTTGFESLKNEPDKQVSERLKHYWEMRLEAVAKEPEENIEEAVEFLGWVKNSPLEEKETFELLYKTLELTNGKIGERNVDDFIEGVCDIAKQNELMALRCLNKAMSDEQMAMYFSLYEKELTEFMESVVQLPDEREDVGQIWTEAIKLADAYGRKHIYEFRPIYEKLRYKVEGAP